MSIFATESSIQMSGAGLIGRDSVGAGASKRITIGSGLTLAGGVLYSSLNPSDYLTIVSAASTYQPLNANLTSLSGISPSDDDFVQRKAGAWVNRTIAQVKTDLALTGTNSGDQTISLTGDVTGSGTGSFAATVANSAITLAKMANVATASVFYRKTAGTGAPEVQTLATLKTDLGLSGTNTGDQDLSAYATVAGSAATFVALAGSYTNPTWIASLAWSKISSTPTTLSGYGITDAYPLVGNPSGFLVSADLSSYLTSATAASTYQPLNANLTTVSGLSPANDDFLQRKAGAWANRTVAQVKTDLGLTGTNSGDQTISLTGDVTGSGTGTFAATVANSAITLAKMANMATASVFYRKTAGTGAPEVQTLATLKTDLGLSGTNTGDQTITLFGDVAGSGLTSFGTTISAGVVSLSKMADVATASVFYRKTAGTGVPEVQTLATLKTDLGLTGTNSGDQDLSSYLTSATAASTYQPLNSNLTTVSGLSPSNDDFLQRKAGAWANRTVAQVKTDLGISGTNTGDQTITLTGDVTGSGTGSFAATIATSSVTLAKMANVATGTVFYRNTPGTGAPEVQTLAALKLGLDLSGTNTGDQDLSGYLTSATAAATYLTSATAASTYLPLAGGALTGVVTSNSAMRIAGAANNGADFEVGSSSSGKGEIYLHGTTVQGSQIRFYAGTTIGMTVGSNDTSSFLDVRDDFAISNVSGYVLAHSGTDLTLYGSSVNCKTFVSGATSFSVGVSYTGATNFERYTLKPTTTDVKFGLEVGSAGGTATRLYRTGHWDSAGTWVDRETLSSGGNLIASGSVTGTGGLISYDRVYHNKYGDDAVAAIYTFRKYRGTESVPAVMQSGDTIGQILFQGYHGASIGTSAAIQVTATDTFTSAPNRPTRMAFNTTAPGDTQSSIRMTITDVGTTWFGAYNTSYTNAGLVGIVGSNASGAENNTLLFRDNSTLNGIGQVLGKIAFWSADTTSPGAGVKAWISCISESATVANAAITFATDTTTGTPSEQMRITSGGNVGIGTGSTISARTHVISTTEQLRIGYDTGDYFSTTVSSTGAVTFDAVGSAPSFAFSDSISCTGAIQSSGTGGVGYATGAGGTVTQATSKTTGVTLNKTTGTITMHNAAMTYNTKVSFTLTNSTIAATDHVVVQHESGGTVGYYFCTSTPAAGSTVITVYLVGFTTGSLSEAIVLRFSVIKSVNA